MSAKTAAQCGVCLEREPGQPTRPVTDHKRSLCTLHSGEGVVGGEVIFSDDMTPEAYEKMLSREGGNFRDPTWRDGRDPNRVYYQSRPDSVAKRQREGWRHEGRSPCRGMEEISLPRELYDVRTKRKGKLAAAQFRSAPHESLEASLPSGVTMELRPGMARQDSITVENGNRKVA